MENLLARLQDRESHVNELTDVRRLTLKQVIQMLTCEHDTDQVLMSKRGNSINLYLLAMQLLELKMI